MDIHDPIEDNDLTKWFPANAETALLVACLLACKDAIRLLRGLDSSVPAADRRGFNLLLTPTASLLDNTEKLNGMLGRQDVSRWPTEDRENLKRYGRAVKKRNSGPLRTLRNAHSAHHDPAAVSNTSTIVRLNPSEVLLGLAEALFVLILRLNHEGVYSWSRIPDPGRPNLLQLRQPGTVGPVTFRMNERNEPVEIIGISLGDEPRLAARMVFSEAVFEYNRLAALMTPKLPSLTLRPRGG